MAFEKEARGIGLGVGVGLGFGEGEDAIEGEKRSSPFLPLSGR